MKTNNLGTAIINRYASKNMLPVEECEHIVRNFVTVPLRANQFSALVSFVNSVGLYAFHRSRLLKYLNEGDPLLAASQFGYWVTRGGKRRTSLVRRRALEKALFLRPELIKSDIGG